MAQPILNFKGKYHLLYLQRSLTSDPYISIQTQDPVTREVSEKREVDHGGLSGNPSPGLKPPPSTGARRR